MDGIEIYTGYYANIRKYMAGGCALVGISVGTPSYLKGNTLVTWRRGLAPSYALVHVEDEREYTRRYRSEVLARLDVHEEIEAVKRIARAQGKRRVVLMCYEKPPRFCHRSLVAEWMNATGEVRVTEYGFVGPSRPASGRLVCGDLFEAAGVSVPHGRGSQESGDWR